MKCPICGLKNVESNFTNCPQCNSDLECFRVLDNLFSRRTIVTNIFRISEKEKEIILKHRRREKVRQWLNLQIKTH